MGKCSLKRIGKGAIGKYNRKGENDMEGKIRGIVRRLDELGRVVIPREYRKMYDINPGDPMEIYAMDNGEIIIRKSDVSSQLELTAAPCVKALSDTTAKTVLLLDLTKFLSGGGIGKARLIGERVPKGIADILRDGKTLSTTTANDTAQVILESSGFEYFAVAPIFYGELATGGLYLLSREPVGGEEMSTLVTLAAVVSESLPKV